MYLSAGLFTSPRIWEQISPGGLSSCLFLTVFCLSSQIPGTSPIFSSLPMLLCQAVALITSRHWNFTRSSFQFWAPELHHRQFILSCDNESTVTVINSGSSKDNFMQRCLRQLWFSASLYDFEFQARHIPGAHNVLADALSRWHSDPSHPEIFQTTARSLGREYNFQQVPLECLQFQVQ